MFETILNYVVIFSFIVFISMFVVSLIDSLFLKNKLNKALEAYFNKKKGNASGTFMMLILVAILIVMLLGFGFVKINMR